MFWKHLGLIALFLIGSVALTFLWLRHYTHHNQRLELPNYVGENLDAALKDAKKQSFRVEIVDSIHIVGREGNEILQQNPKPGSLVKEHRTIYVTVTKKNPDRFAVRRLPELYGKSYHRKQRELLQSFELRSAIVGRRYDPGEPDHILKVIYQGDTIIDRRGRMDDIMLEKGGTLEYIVSERSGGRLEIPDLVCKTYAEAKFLIASSGLTLGEVITDGKVGAEDAAFVSGQVPDPEEGFMVMGQEIKLSLTREKPLNCK